MCQCVWFNIIRLLSVSSPEIIDTVPYGCQCVHENMSNVESIHKWYDYRQTDIRRKNQCTYIDMSRIQILIFITTTISRTTCLKFDTHSYVLQLPLINACMIPHARGLILYNLPFQLITIRQHKILTGLSEEQVFYTFIRCQFEGAMFYDPRHK